MYPDKTTDVAFASSSRKNVRFTFTAQQTGVHRLTIESPTPTEMGTYKVAFKELTDDYPADTTTSGLVTLSGDPASGSASGEIGIIPHPNPTGPSVGTGSGTDTDWFRVSLAADTSYGIRPTPAAGDGSLSSPTINGIYDSSGNLIAGTPGRTSFTTGAAGGTFYIEVASRGGAAGAYDLTVTRQRSVSERPGEDLPDFRSQVAATDAFLSVDGEVTGNIYRSLDIDHFRVTLEAGTTYRFDLKGADTGSGEGGGGTLGDPWIVNMFYSDLTPLGSRVVSPGAYYDIEANGYWPHHVSNWDSGTGRNAQVYFAPDDSGDYWMSVSGEGSTGTYTLSLVQVDADDYADDTTTTATVTVGGSANAEWLPL